MACKVQKWKEKAINRRIEIWRLNKRIEELTRSRDNWKLKCKALKSGQTRICPKDTEMLKMEKIKHHSYSQNLITWCMNLRTKGGCSLRGCIQVLSVLQLMLQIELKLPSASSIRNWEMKMGYYQINEQTAGADTAWGLIIDESISIGSQKILLLLGVNLNDYKFSQPLSMSDVEILSVNVKKSWSAEEINVVVQKVISRGYCFRYCCSDNGNNLRKSLKMNNLVHIEDCGHCLGKLLEKKYKKAEVYLEFCKEKSLFQKRNLLSKHAVFLPPKQRAKGRYMNLSSTIKWAYNVLRIAQEYEKTGENSEAFDKIKWIIIYQDFITTLHHEQVLINQINKILKSEGLNQQAISKITSAIEQCRLTDNLGDNILDYVSRNILKLPDEKSIICSSDIIESMFGKFKRSVANNSASGLTEGCLSIANYGKNISSSEVKNALERVKIIDIQDWRKENLPISLHQQRKRLFNNTG